TTGDTNTTEIPEEQHPEETPAEQPAAQQQIPEMTDFELANITPRKTNKGEVLFSIQVKNTGTVQLKNLIPLIVGRGFSSYDVMPITTLNPGQTGTAMVAGQLSEAGEILLTIRINEKIFYDKVTVDVPTTTVDPEELKAQEEAKKTALEVLQQQLDDFKARYESLEAQLRSKKVDYDTSDVKLDDLKKYLMSAESTLLTSDVEKTNISLLLAEREFEDQNEKLANASKKPFLARIKDNVVIISAIAGAIITIFAFIELIKKQKQGLSQKIKEFKVNKDIKITVTKEKDKTKGTRKRKTDEEKKAEKVARAEKAEKTEQKKEDQKEAKDGQKEEQKQ
ncbi:MAG: hypothetical protein KJ574_04250, partial [Nanoarchaeota archaeon]|nr:hypothetical protein [Nanoarchaeota archaeon]